MNDRPFFTFLVFVVISAAAWFVVKLSEDYTTQVQFRLRIEDVPADKWLSPAEQTAKLSMTTNGFNTLRYKMIREQRRVVYLPLSEVSYRLERGTTYSFGSPYVSERVAALLSVSASDLTMNDDKVYFNLDPLKSKVVPVKLTSDIRTQRQYEVYGIPLLEPSSVKVYGSAELIDTLKSVRTQLLAKSNASSSFTETVMLDLLDDRLHSEVKSIEATVQVERFTETDVKVPLTQPESLQVRFFPEEVTVKCHVAVKDYSNLTSDLFRVVADSKQIDARDPLLNVLLTDWPPFVQILSVTPEKVEYLIVQ